MEKIIPLDYAIISGDPEDLPNREFYYSSSYELGSANYEEALTLYALVLCSKPKMVLETGTYTGFTALHIALALKHNGFGKLITIECQPDLVTLANSRFKTNNLDEYAECLLENSLNFIENTQLKFDFAFLDTDIPIRPTEFKLLKSKLNPKAIIVIHDTSPLHPYRHNTMIREELSMEKIINIETPRGLSIIQTP